MKSHASEKTRHLVLRGESGDMLPESLTKALDDLQVACGWMRGSGVLADVQLRAFDSADRGPRVGSAHRRDGASDRARRERRVRTRRSGGRPAGRPRARNGSRNGDVRRRNRGGPHRRARSAGDRLRRSRARAGGRSVRERVDARGGHGAEDAASESAAAPARPASTPPAPVAPIAPVAVRCAGCGPVVTTAPVVAVARRRRHSFADLRARAAQQPYSQAPAPSTVAEREKPAATGPKRSPRAPTRCEADARHRRGGPSAAHFKGEQPHRRADSGSRRRRRALRVRALRGREERRRSPAPAARQRWARPRNRARDAEGLAARSESAISAVSGSIARKL